MFVLPPFPVLPGSTAGCGGVPGCAGPGEEVEERAKGGGGQRGAGRRGRRRGSCPPPLNLDRRKTEGIRRCVRVCCVRVNGRGGVGRVGSSGDGGRVWLAGAVPVRWCGVVVQTPNTRHHRTRLYGYVGSRSVVAICVACKKYLKYWILLMLCVLLGPTAAQGVSFWNG